MLWQTTILWVSEETCIYLTFNFLHLFYILATKVNFIYCSSMLSLHLSGLAEEFLIYSTKEFDFLTLFEQSSISNRLESDSISMELVRGASVQICACLTGIMMTTKNLRTSCHKDWQCDKRYCFETFDALQEALRITANALRGLKIKPPQMETTLCPEMLAIDWVGLRFFFFAFYTHHCKMWEYSFCFLP